MQFRSKLREMCSLMGLPWILAHGAEKGRDIAAGEQWTASHTQGPATAWHQRAEGLGASYAFCRPSAGSLVGGLSRHSQTWAGTEALKLGSSLCPPSLEMEIGSPFPSPMLLPIRKAKGSWK